MTHRSWSDPRLQKNTNGFCSHGNEAVQYCQWYRLRIPWVLICRHVWIRAGEKSRKCNLKSTQQKVVRRVWKLKTAEEKFMFAVCAQHLDKCDRASSLIMNAFATLTEKKGIHGPLKKPSPAEPINSSFCLSLNLSLSLARACLEHVPIPVQSSTWNRSSF